MTKPRQVPSQDEKYMGEAFFKSFFSKDPNTQMGAVIVGEGNVPLGSGYNGPPVNIVDNKANWARKSLKGELNKYDICIHAERNAIKWSEGSPFLEGATIYVTGLPCEKCMLEIIHAKISKVVYYPHKSNDPKSMFNDKSIFEKTFKLAQHGGVELEEFYGNLNFMRDGISHLMQLGVFS